MDDGLPDVDLAADEPAGLDGERVLEGDLADELTLDLHGVLPGEVALHEGLSADDGGVSHGSVRVHVDVALEGGAVSDEDAGSADIAGHLAAGGDLDALLGGDVAGERRGSGSGWC